MYDHRYAQFIIGFHYEQGIKVNKDIQMAKHFYLSSAQQNYLDAQAAIGNILIAEHQYEEGLTWLTKAANMVILYYIRYLYIYVPLIIYTC